MDTMDQINQPIEIDMQIWCYKRFYVDEWYNHNQTKYNKAAWIFYGTYCTCDKILVPLDLVWLSAISDSWLYQRVHIMNNKCHTHNDLT